jgi:hypothetical protein
MARKRRRGSGIGDKATGTILVVVGVVLVGLMAATAWLVTSSRPALDAQTNCPLAGPTSIRIVIIDQSDPISTQQAQRVRQEVSLLKENAQFGDRFDVYTFEGQVEAELRPILSLCSPGRDANPLVKNPKIVRERYERQFAEVVDRAIDGLLTASTRPTSPIIETLRAAAITSFGPNADRGIPRHVTLISDMIQHSELASNIRTSPNFQDLAKSRAWPLLQPNLRTADVRILYLLRPTAMRGGKPIQDVGHQLFWEQLISAAGGQLDRIEPI